MSWTKSSAVDAKATEDDLRSNFPKLLHKDEHIELAFRDRGGKGRDSEYFTTHRILIEDGKGIGSKRKNYLSIPYNEILCFSVQSAGSFLDASSELFLYTATHSEVKINFKAKHVDLFDIYQFINGKIPWTDVRGTVDPIDTKPPRMDQKESKTGKFLDWLGDNAKQIDPKMVETKLKTEYPILMQTEVVELAFKSGRDTTLFTNRRMLIIDVKGLTGKKIEFLSLLYDAIHGFSVETAGGFLDRDSEMRLYTNMLHQHYEFTQDFRKNQCNLWAIQKHLCNHVLGEDKDVLDDIVAAEENYNGDGLFSILKYITNSAEPISVSMMDKALRHNPPILQSSEHVEMAFQGRRDITIFTTKRLLVLDKQGMFGKKVEYTSVPWEKFVAFGIRSAGAILDFDTEVLLFTEMGFFPGEAGHPGGENSPPKPPIPPEPEESCFELDFNKYAVNIYKLKYYLSRRIMETTKENRGAPIDLDSITFNPPDPSAFDKLFEWFGNDQREIDPTELDREFHTNTQILLDGETCLMAFKAGRDISLFTNLRIMLIDVQGLMGHKVEYTSIPYRNVRAWAVESAGKWDHDSELKIYTRNRWHLAKLELDFAAGKTDIMQLQQLLSAFVVGTPEDPTMVFRPKNYEAHEANKFKMGDMFKNRSKEIDVSELEWKFHNDIPILLEKEHIVRAFEQARDMYLFTDRRYIRVDTKGMSGKKVNYRSIPYKDVGAFEFETAGNFDKDAELYFYTDISDIVSISPPRWVGLKRTKQSIAVKSTDIYDMGALAMEKTIVNAQSKNIVVPQVEFEW